MLLFEYNSVYNLGNLNNFMMGDKEKAARVVGKIEKKAHIRDLEKIEFTLLEEIETIQTDGFVDKHSSKGVYYRACMRDGKNREGWVKCKPILWGWGRARRVLEIVALHYASEGIKVTTDLTSPITRYLYLT